MHSLATRGEKCCLIIDEKEKCKGLWYSEKFPARCDLVVEPCKGLKALELHCFL